MTAYTPRPGSTAHVLLTALSLPTAPERIYRGEIRRVTQKPPTNIDLALAVAVRHGAIVRGRDPDGRIWYALPGSVQ
ncbi:MAG: hypothetical protein BroJett024_41450 [Alphaproteobacteria bacterium]|nr:MAG: hypothetical protein BroJett024_41450 [Alphaproteobacteria bacterium]